MADWHLDKKVPIGLIVAIVIQTLTLVYVGATWKAETNGRLTALENSAAELAEDYDAVRRRTWDEIKELKAANTKLDSQFSTLDERTKAIQAQSSQIQSQVDRILNLMLAERQQK